VRHAVVAADVVQRPARAHFADDLIGDLRRVEGRACFHAGNASARRPSLAALVSSSTATASLVDSPSMTGLMIGKVVGVIEDCARMRARWQAPREQSQGNAGKLDCFGARAPRNDGGGFRCPLAVIASDSEAIQEPRK
jgi:hypothetical protein